MAGQGGGEGPDPADRAQSAGGHRRSPSRRLADAAQADRRGTDPLDPFDPRYAAAGTEIDLWSPLALGEGSTADAALPRPKRASLSVAAVCTFTTCLPSVSYDLRQLMRPPPGGLGGKPPDMPAQVVQLFNYLERARDWTQRELSEFYRVESALIQAGMALETERGVTDEGEPWFVFCRADTG